MRAEDGGTWWSAEETRFGGLPVTSSVDFTLTSPPNFTSWLTPPRHIIKYEYRTSPRHLRARSPFLQ
jgi:hypothetical protein